MILHILDQTGDTQVVVEEDVTLAESLFAEAMANGKMAYAVVSEGGNVIVNNLQELPEKTERIVMRPAYAGG